MSRSWFPITFAPLTALCLALPATAQTPLAPPGAAPQPLPPPAVEQQLGPQNAVMERADSAPPRWPVEFETDSGTLVIYLPQLESFANNQIAARAAFSYARADSAPKYGTFWFTARVDVDRDANLVTARSLTVTRVRFPNITADKQEQFEAFVRARLEESELSASVDRIVALVAATELEKSTAQDIRTDPPRIIIMSKPTVLLLFDGDPILRPMTDNPRYQRVVNTAMAVVKDTTSGLFYLSGGGFWYQARTPMGPWDPADSVPDSLRTMVPDTMDFDTPDGPPPDIITAKSPTELIVTTGPMQFEAVPGTSLHFVSNTESDILKEGATNYVLLSGRWYAAADLAGPWRHIRPDSLPASFAKIYPTSVVGDVLAFVPGTPQAAEATADALIPQTSTIRRDAATLTVEYDGEPDFEAIPGTQIEWAYNTATPVMKIGTRYYACDNAVWFVSASAMGPWIVSDSVPQAVQSIPASSPIYNVKYAQVYEHTTTTVTVGYTPGYVGMYPYYGTVVYGTGYPYPPYMGAGVYYPRPVTYGYAYHYNPYTGWGVGVAAGGAFLAVGVAFRPPYPAYRAGGVYGAAGYRPGYGGGNVSARPGAGARPGARPSTGNIYNRPGNTARNAPRASTQPRRAGTGAGGARPSTGMGAGGRAGAGGARPSTGMGGGGRPNNVYSAPNGSVMRQQGNNWQGQGANGGWGAAGRGAPSTMNRDAQARNRGASREAGRSSYGGGGGRGGGGMRGGGGGGRRR